MMGTTILSTVTMGESLTLWTIRLSLVFYVIAVSLLLLSRRSPFANSARMTWTIACGLYVVHVLCAFHFHHEWSHAKAYAHTADQTLEIIGWNWGGGIYFNYFFTLLWTRDVLIWWVTPVKYPKRELFLHLATHTFIAFIAFNATVIFATGYVRWMGVVASIWLSMLCIWRYRLGDCKLSFEMEDPSDRPVEK